MGAFILRSIFSTNHFWDRLSMFQLLRPHLVSITYVFVIFALHFCCLWFSFWYTVHRAYLLLHLTAHFCNFSSSDRHVFWTNGPSIAIFVIHVIVKDISKSCTLPRCRSDIRSIIIYVTLGFVSGKSWMSDLVSLGTGLLRWAYYQTSRNCSQLSNIVINFELQISIPAITVSNVNYKNIHQWSWKICSAKTEPLGVWDGL